MTSQVKRGLLNEVFALRNGEVYQVFTEPPDSGRWIAVQIIQVTMPLGGAYPETRGDGKLVEQAAVIACERNDSGWKWVPLSAPSKEAIGDLLFDSGCDLGRWYFLAIKNSE